MNIKFVRTRIKMTKFGLKGKITGKEFMIHVLHNLPHEYDVTMNKLENSLTSYGPDTLTIEVIHEKLSHWFEMIQK